MKSPYITGSVVEGPVALVLVEAGGRLNAMTVSFFSELSHHPTSLWVSIAQTTYTHSLIQECGQFTLAVLSSDQKEIALACGSVSGRQQNKWSWLDVYKTPEDFWVLRGALTSTTCVVRGSLPLGDHTIFLAHTLSGMVDSRRAHRRHLLVSDL